MGTLKSRPCSENTCRALKMLGESSSSSERSSLRETMREMEAKEWINRFQTKRQTQGLGNAKVWWEVTLDDIAKKRGKPAAEDLRQRMNRIKNEISRKS